MEKIKKNFGFGFMRLPTKDGEIDTEETKRMVDAFLDAGFNYFKLKVAEAEKSSAQFIFYIRHLSPEL